MKLKEYLDARGVRHSWFAENVLGIKRNLFQNVMSGKSQLPVDCYRTVVEYTRGRITLEDLVQEAEEFAARKAIKKRKEELAATERDGGRKKKDPDQSEEAK